VSGIAPPSRPSSFVVSMVTTSHIQLSFVVLEGSESVTHFLLNTTTNRDRDPYQKVIARGNLKLLDVTKLDHEKLVVKLMVSELHPFIRYTFQVAAVSEVGEGEFSSVSSPAHLSESQPHTPGEYGANYLTSLSFYVRTTFMKLCFLYVP